MIGLSDIGLAHLVIAATRVAPSGRGKWLQSIARELEGHPPSATARRLRKYQARRKRGLRCFRVTLDEIDTEEMLLACGLLAPAERDATGAVERALERFLALCYRNAFQQDQEIYANVRTELALSALEKALSHASPKRVRK